MRRRLRLRRRRAPAHHGRRRPTTTTTETARLRRRPRRRSRRPRRLAPTTTTVAAPPCRPHGLRPRRRPCPRSPRGHDARASTPARRRPSTSPRASPRAGARRSSRTAGAHAVTAGRPASRRGRSESSQTVTFTVSTDNASLFSAAPAVSPNGTLTYTLGARRERRCARDRLRRRRRRHRERRTRHERVAELHDHGHCPSTTRRASTPGANQTVVSLLGARDRERLGDRRSRRGRPTSRRRPWLQGERSNGGLFAVQPTVSSSGKLTYTPKALALGSATVTVTPVDNGGSEQRWARHRRAAHVHDHDRLQARCTRPGRLAQLGEHLPYKEGVAGSSPAPPMYETLLSMPNLRQKASPLQRPLDPLGNFWATPDFLTDFRAARISASGSTRPVPANPRSRGRRSRRARGASGRAGPPPPRDSTAPRGGAKRESRRKIRVVPDFYAARHSRCWFDPVEPRGLSLPTSPALSVRAYECYDGLLADRSGTQCVTANAAKPFEPSVSSRRCGCLHVCCHHAGLSDAPTFLAIRADSSDIERMNPSACSISLQLVGVRM